MNKTVSDSIYKLLINFNTNGFKKSDIDKVINDKNKNLLFIHNHFVDLGLPSGNLWAKYNLGPKWDELDKPSYLYRWGEIEPATTYRNDKNAYKFFKKYNEHSIGHEILKYNTKDNLTELELCDDAAYLFNPLCSIPTIEDAVELYELCDTDVINIDGHRYIKIIGPNNNYILFGNDSIWDIWTASIALWDSNKANLLRINPNETNIHIQFQFIFEQRYISAAIRPIIKNYTI